MEELIDEIINEQFKIIGVKVLFKNIPKEGIKVKKKKVMWYDYYKFETETEYLKWKEWAKNRLKENNIENKFDEIDMLYGLSYKWEETKRGQLF